MRSADLHGLEREVAEPAFSLHPALPLPILAPDDRTQVTLLAKAARLCRDPRLVRGLRAGRTGREVVRLIRASEAVVFRPDPEAEREKR